MDKEGPKSVPNKSISGPRIFPKFDISTRFGATWQTFFLVNTLQSPRRSKMDRPDPRKGHGPIFSSLQIVNVPIGTILLNESAANG